MFSFFIIYTYICYIIFTDFTASFASSFCISTPIIFALVFVLKIKGIGALPVPISNIFSAFLDIVTKLGNKTESKEKLNISVS